MEAELRQPAATPDPVTGNGIDKRADHGTVNAVGNEFRTLSHSTGNDGGRSRTEHSLEHEVCPFGNTGGQDRGIGALGQKINSAD